MATTAPASATYPAKAMVNTDWNCKGLMNEVGFAGVRHSQELPVTISDLLLNNCAARAIVTR
jgi:hypothetical protein